MTAPEWLKPGLLGAGAGAIALAMVGFSWGGWVTGSTAEAMATDRAQVEVVNALVPFCVERSQTDPEVARITADLEAAASYKRTDILIDAGWATMPGAVEADRDLAKACILALAAGW